MRYAALARPSEYSPGPYDCKGECGASTGGAGSPEYHRKVAAVHGHHPLRALDGGLDAVRGQVGAPRGDDVGHSPGGDAERLKRRRRVRDGEVAFLEGGVQVAD